MDVSVRRVVKEVKELCIQEREERSRKSKKIKFACDSELFIKTV